MAMVNEVPVPSEEQPLTIPEFAALCREKCDRPAQGHDDRACGSTVTNDEGETLTAFCGYHWGFVL